MNALSISLLFGALFVVLMPLYGLIRVINRIAKRKVAPVGLPLVLGIAALLGVSLLLDASGSLVEATITAKHDHVRINHSHGTWRRTLSVDVAQDSSPDVIFTLHATPRHFDTIRVGERVSIRLIELGRFLRFARFAEDSTFTTLASFLPSLGSSDTRLNGQGVVTKIDRFEHVFFRGRHTRRTYLQWPYDIVQVQFIPTGRTDAITLVDVIEHASKPDLLIGDSVNIVWSPDNPRVGSLVGTRSGSLLKNLLFEFALHIPGVILLFGGIGVWWRARKKRRSERALAATRCV